MSRLYTGADWDTSIRNLVRDSGMPLSKFAEAIGMAKGETLEWWSGGGTDLKFSHISSLASFLGVSTEDLITGACSTGLVRQRIFEGPSVLPEMFSQNASSFVRTSAHIVEYLSLMYGRRFVDKILVSMNIHPLFFENLDNRINLLFFIKFLNRLSEHGLTENEIESLACYLFLRIQHTEIGKSFAKAKTYAESYAVLADYVTLFESNFEYKFEIGMKDIRIHAKPTEARQFVSRDQVQEYERLFNYRRKAFGWFPLLSRLAPLNLNTPSCFLRGDAETIYECDYPLESGRGVLYEGQRLLLL